MATGKIIGAAYLVDATTDRERPPPTGGPVIAIAATCPPSGVVLPVSVVAWVCAAAAAAAGDEPRFQSDVDLRPYFRVGDPVEIDPYQGLIRHLREGYAFPVRAVR
ncbi:MAG: hypothetical protein PVF51_08190 [Nitrospirota bacterium]|jgi:hypothetical protein